MARTNKNENPLRRLDQIDGSVKWRRYDQRHLFDRLCTLRPDPERERLEVWRVHDEDGMKRRGFVYALVIDDRILKIGQTIQTFKGRLRSYNTGKVAYRSRATNSGANFFILQSVLHIRKNVGVHCFFLDHKKWSLLGETGYEPFPSSKVAEGILLRKFKERYGTLPIGCSQS